MVVPCLGIEGLNIIKVVVEKRPPGLVAEGALFFLEGLELAELGLPEVPGENNGDEEGDPVFRVSMYLRLGWGMLGSNKEK